MLNELGAIIDRLYDRKRSGGRLRKRILFIVGNGIRNVSNILSEEKIREHARKKGIKRLSPAKLEKRKWEHFEYARYYTATALPSFAHCCIHQLAKDGLCRDIVTTNYDLFFDGIWERSPDLPVYRNPVAAEGEFLWEDYYSPRKSAKSGIRYWKIHGSLSHVSFGRRSGADFHHIHRLPRFAISTNNADLTKAYRIPTQAPYMGFETQSYPQTRFSPLDDLEAGFRPFLDWTYGNDRTRFQREIDAVMAILSNPTLLAAVVLLGFSGYHNGGKDAWNEELVPAIRKIMQKNSAPVFMAVHEKQYQARRKPPYGLLRELDKMGRCKRYRHAGVLIHSLLRRYSRRFPIDYAEFEYHRWRQWCLHSREEKHV